MSSLRSSSLRAFGWDPFVELSRWSEDVARAASARRAWAPPVDVYEDETAIVVRAELPGLDPEDVSVTVDKNVLTLEGERRLARGEKETVHRVESSHGAFKRSFALPKTVEADAIEAKLERGVLTVRLPKRAEVQPRKIAVKVEAAHPAA